MILISSVRIDPFISMKFLYYLIALKLSDIKIATSAFLSLVYILYHFLAIYFQPTSVFTCEVNLLDTAHNWTLLFFKESILILSFNCRV